MRIFLAEITPTNPQLQWGIIGLAAATIVYVTIIRPAFKKKKDPLERTPAMGSLSQQRSVERQMQNLLVELSEMARQISAQLDTRSEKLQILIQDADQRIAALQQLEQHPVPMAPARWTVSPAPAEPSAPIAPISDPVDSQHQPIYTLADEGRSAMDIARELNRPRGEVELILALRPR